jgi:hypothetical protein
MPSLVQEPSISSSTMKTTHEANRPIDWVNGVRRMFLCPRLRSNRGSAVDGTLRNGA